MKVLTKIILSLFLIICYENLTAQVGSKLTINPENIKQGQKVSFTYQPKFKNIEKLDAYLLYFSSKRAFYHLDIDLKNNKGVYNAEVAIPDSAVLAAFIFKNKDEIDDNNKQGYIYLIKDDNGAPIKSANASLSVIHENIGSFFLGMDANVQEAIKYTQAEMTAFPDSKKDILFNYANLLFNSKKTKEVEALKPDLMDAFTISKTEEEKGRFYYLINRLDKLKGDSLVKIIRTTYPNGLMISDEKLSAFSKEKDITKMEANYVTLMADKDSKINKDMLTYNLARAYSNNKTYDRFLVTIEKMQQKSNVPSLLNSVAWPMAEKGEELVLASKLSKKSLDLLDELRNDKTYYNYYSAKQKENAINLEYAMYADTYGLLLFKLGNLDEALKYQEKSVYLNDFNSVEVNARYTQFLIAKGENQKAEETIKKLIAEGKSTDAMKDQLKGVYLKKHTEQEYLTLLAGLEKGAKEALRIKMMAKMLNIKSPEFSLKNLAGETVSLASLKGKVVIADFWATWCGPCIQSFPGMQKAINKYKYDKNVAFVFIDTWENVHDEKRIELVSKFITNNNYTFNVLLDTETATDKTKYDVVSAFKVDGIPTKFILDKEGYIRFKSVGFSGSADKIVDEISTMIDLAANPKATASAGSN
jgi:thiol-disulfide isomerase/thioredoxin